MRPTRRIAFPLAALALALTAAAGGRAAGLVPSHGALFGIHADPRDGRTRLEELRHVEAEIGRRFDVERSYYRWDMRIPDKTDARIGNHGRILFVNWKAQRKDSRRVSWRAIANGRYDRWIKGKADALRTYGRRVFFTFNHEPEDDVAKNGTRADYRAAWRHIVTIFRRRGATNVVWVWTLMASTFERRPGVYYPGDSYVDWIAADGYNWFRCRARPWRSFGQVFGPFYAWGTAHSKPLFVSEWGSVRDPAWPGRQARWVKAAREKLKLWPRVKGVSYFNSARDCRWYVDTTTSSRRAYTAMANDAYFVH